MSVLEVSPAPGGGVIPSRGRLAGSTRRRPARHGATRWLALVPLAAVVAVSVIGPFFLPYDPERIVGRPRLAPSSAHWMGTDSVGMDVFSRTIAAARVDLGIAALVMIAATVLGLLVGLAVGMNEHRRGPLGLGARGITRSVDLLESLPSVVVALAVVAFLGGGITTMAISISILLLPAQIRLTRTEVLRVRTEPYLDAGRQAGFGELRIALRHTMPNSAWPALENASVVFGGAILLTATLGFLGAGMPAPTPEWGAMIAGGVSDAAVGRWWPAAFPALFVCLTVASVSLAARCLLGLIRHH